MDSEMWRAGLSGLLDLFIQYLVKATRCEGGESVAIPLIVVFPSDLKSPV